MTDWIKKVRKGLLSESEQFHEQEMSRFGLIGGICKSCGESKIGPTCFCREDFCETCYAIHAKECRNAQTLTIAEPNRYQKKEKRTFGRRHPRDSAF